ncbi:MAG: hypothetical protein ABR987_17880 [Terracidiphilus sp.]|jgi:hypothetical protein
MTIRFLIGVAFFCVGMAGGLLGNTAIWRMIEEVDRNRPKGERFSEMLFLRHRTWEILDEYRRLLANGKLRRQWRVGITLLLVGFGGTAAWMFLRWQ